MYEVFASVVRPLPVVALVASFGGSGCVLEDAEVGSTDQAALNPNALNPNALNPNALNPNALNPNALNPNALNPNALNPEALEALQAPDGDLSRELVRYAVGCAFEPHQSFELSWTDDRGEVRHESYAGLLGLAPDWQLEPLDQAGQRWVSACLASRVNANGTSVMLSSRGAHPGLATTSAERYQYSMREAAFFGNLFSGDQVVEVCHDPLTNLQAHLQERVCGSDLISLPLDLTQRCGREAVRCGAVILRGSCDVWLSRNDPCHNANRQERYYQDCSTCGGTDISEAITTFLPGTLGSLL